MARLVGEQPPEDRAKRRVGRGAHERADHLDRLGFDDGDLARDNLESASRRRIAGRRHTEIVELDVQSFETAERTEDVGAEPHVDELVPDEALDRAERFERRFALGE